MGQLAHTVPALDVGGLDLLLEQFQLPDPRDRDLVLVRDETAIEVNGEGQEDDENRYQDDTGRPSRDLREIVELDPAEDRDFHEEQ